MRVFRLLMQQIRIEAIGLEGQLHTSPVGCAQIEPTI